MDWVKIAEYVALAVGVVAGLFIGWKEWKERRARSNGLAPNPTRCEDHEGRLRKVEEVCTKVGPQISGLEKDVQEIKTDVKQLISIHLKQ